MSDKVYIHYGATSFDIDKFIEPQYSSEWDFKPVNGLWASEDTDDEEVYTWRQWCENENFCLHRLNYYFRFKLSENAKPFIIKDKEVIESQFIYNRSDSFIGKHRIRFKELLKHGYTHIEFHENGWTHWHFYAWDCDCILIIDPSIIIPLKE